MKKNTIAALAAGLTVLALGASMVFAGPRAAASSDNRETTGVTAAVSDTDTTAEASDPSAIQTATRSAAAPTCQYSDLDGDGVCDLCGSASCPGAPQDGTGAQYGAQSGSGHHGACQYSDLNGDGVCDLCGSASCPGAPQDGTGAQYGASHHGSGHHGSGHHGGNHHGE